MAFSIGEECTGCTACVRSCPVFAIAGERGKHHEINPLRCVECGVCGRVCPGGAISDGGGKTCSPVKRSPWSRPRVDEKLCSACGICVYDCVFRALSISLPRERGDIRVYAELSGPDKCVGCGICEKHCPLGVIVMIPPQSSAAETQVKEFSR